MSSLLSLLRILGIAFLSSIITILLIGGMVYAATGTRLLEDFQRSGVNFVSFFEGTGTGNV